MKKIILNKLIKKNFNPNQFLKLQKFLSSKGIILKKKSTFRFGFEKFRTLYFTGLSSLLIILFAFLVPIFTEINPKVTKNSKINESNKKFKKVLEGGEVENKSKIDEGLDLSNILEDVLNPSDFHFYQMKLNKSRAPKKEKVYLFKLYYL